MARLVSAPLDIEFCVFDNREDLKREFNMLSESDDDPVGQWLKLAKARGETSESDQVMLTLMVELHRKIDDLTAFVKNEKPEYIKLPNKAQIESIGFENFYVKNGKFEKDKEYYGRVSMPVFPKREIPLFFVGMDEGLVQIKRLHQRDRKDWNAYFTARERVMIRELKAKDEY